MTAMWNGVVQSPPTAFTITPCLDLAPSAANNLILNIMGFVEADISSGQTSRDITIQVRATETAHYGDHLGTSEVLIHEESITVVYPPGFTNDPENFSGLLVPFSTTITLTRSNNNGIEGNRGTCYDGLIQFGIAEMENRGAPRSNVSKLNL